MGARGRAAAAVVGLWVVGLAVNRSLRRIRGSSMVPTLAPGDVVLVAPVRSPGRGTVVLLRDPRDPGRVQVKRVVGLGGETVRITAGRLTLDDLPHDEPYAVGRGPDGSLTVAPDGVAVLGDARHASTDSRSYGSVPVTAVEARVLARVRPRPRLVRAMPPERRGGH